MKHPAWAAWPVLMTLSVTPAHSGLRESVAGVDRGEIRFSFDARPDAFGDGDQVFFGQASGDCYGRRGLEGPVRVALHVREGRVRDVDVRIDGREPGRGKDLVDLGHVPVTEAAGYLLDLAARSETGVARDALLAASLGREAVIWPRLLEIARDASRPLEVRKCSVFWLGQAAGEKVAGELDRLAAEEDQDLELREHAIFSLSQREADEAVPILIRVARDHSRRALRKTALFWLAQIDDPRVLPVFEEILTAN